MGGLVQTFHRRTVGPLVGKGTYEGHIEAAKDLKAGLNNDIQDFDTSGCGSHFKIPQRVRSVADMAIPTKPTLR